MANLVYSPKDILQKEFKTKMMNGYDLIEVDELLDNVIRDCEAYNRELLNLQEENSRLVTKLDQLSRAQPTPRVAQEISKSAAVTNFDILRRLSNLEYGVLSKKLDETPSTPVAPSAPSMPAEPANHDADSAQARQL